MLSRRSMIRALGFGVPAAAVTAAVGLPKPASGGYVLSTASHKIGEVGPEFHWPSASLTAFEAEMGEVTSATMSSYQVMIREAVTEEIKARGPLAREMERTYGLRRSLA